MMKTESSNSQTSLGKLATTLIVTALCSQLPSVGWIAVYMATWIGSYYLDPNQGSLSLWGITVSFGIWIVAITILSAGPMFLSLYFNWNRRGLYYGLLASIIVAACWGISWYVEGLYESKGFSYDVSGGIVIALLLVVSGKIKSNSDIVGLVLAIIIGLAVSVGFILKFVTYVSLNTGISAPFLWIWLSAVFFPELFSRRIDWRGALVYILMMVVFTIIILKYYPQ